MDRENKLPGPEEVNEILALIKKLGIIDGYFDKLEIHIERFVSRPGVPEKQIYMKFTYQNHYATGRMVDTCELSVQLAVTRGSVAGFFSINDFVWDEKENIIEVKNICGNGPAYTSLDVLAILIAKVQEMGCLNKRFRYTWQSLDAYKGLMPEVKHFS